MNAIVEFRDVTYAINGRPILNNISFTIVPGESVVFLGRSGSGKTTTLKLINRLIEPSTGAVFVEGKNARDWNPIQLRRRIGYVIQEIGLFPHFTVERNVGLVPSLEAWPEPTIHTRVEEMLRLVGLEPQRFAQRLPREGEYRWAPLRSGVRCRPGPLEDRRRPIARESPPHDSTTRAGVRRCRPATTRS